MLQSLWQTLIKLYKPKSVSKEAHARHPPWSGIINKKLPNQLILSHGSIKSSIHNERRADILQFLISMIHLVN